MSPRPSRPFAFAGALALAALVALSAPCGTARADWLPLAVGNQWNYMDSGDDPHSEEITDPIHVRGRHMFMKTYVGGLDDGLVNFWMLDTDGGILLGGYYRAIIPFGLVYEPPVKIFPGAPSVGLEWSQHTIAYSIPDNVIFGEFDSYWRVQQHLTLMPPAGTFDCYGVGQVAPPALVASPQGQALTIDGRIARPAAATLDTGPASAYEWYADNVGLVEYLIDVPYRLMSYSLPTPAAASSWGRIKSLYR